MQKSFERGRSNRFAVELFRPLPKRYDLAAELLSFGQNRRWRRRMIDAITVRDADLICDVATGTAGVALQLTSRTGADVVGVDVSEAMLRRGQANVMRSGPPDRIRFVIGTGERLPFPDDTFDALTFTYLFRYVKEPFATLRELSRVVKPGGRIAMLEFLVPPNRMWRGLWWFYTRSVLPVAGLFVGRGWFEVGRFLGPSISEHYRRFPVSRQMDEWAEAGMESVECEEMSLGGGIVMWGDKRVT
jgi:demethylmenaquinone methyltransferase/2-methoxy-6-polyprenyl-1,4-benzoquinol methylase